MGPTAPIRILNQILCCSPTPSPQIAGITFSSTCYTAKYASRDGSRLWERRYNSPAKGADSATCLALGPNGVIVVGGYSDAVPGPGVDWDATIVAYRDLPAASGIEVWAGGVRLRLAGTAGQTYEILRATTLTGPWARVTSAIASPAGIVEAEDASPTQGAAFYRTRTE